MLGLTVDFCLQIPSDWPLKVLFTGGQPISRTIAKCIDKGLCKWFGVEYGSSETTHSLCHLVNNSDAYTDHSCGKPIPDMELKIVDEKGEIAPVYIRGELCIRTKAMFAGYYNDPEKTKEVLTEDGWYKTDDIAFMTKDGTFYIEGRKSDMIISSGMHIMPNTWEALLRNYVGVKDAMVIPIPHKILNQVLCVCFILHSDMSCEAESLRKYCEHIYADKPQMLTVLPTHYLPFTSFPETASGKPSRKLLAAEAVRRLREIQNQ